ncbi:MAG: HlyD family efflux transporter periplasmic adaptor subunit, partial [Pseudomonadota bacterium]
AVAAVCLWLWQSVADGALRTGLAATVVVACTASLFVNANPLMKFDGYHILQDLLGTTNLQAESAQTLRRLAWRALGARGRATTLDRRWRLYAVYGVSALAFKVAIVLGIAVWFAVDFPLVGLALAALLLCSAAVLPLLGFARQTVRDRATLFPSGGRQLRAASTVVALAVVVFVVPFPHYASAEGVSTVPREAQLVSKTHGELVRLIEDGARVEAGQAIARLTAFDTQREHDRQALDLARRTQERHGVQFHADASRRATSAQMLPGIAVARAELERLADRLADQVIRSGSAGRVSFAPERSAPGQFVARGQVIGTVIAENALMARVMLRQQTADTVLDGLHAVSVWVPGRTPGVFNATVDSISPMAVSDGFAPAFTRDGGGEIATDAENRSVETGAAYVDMRLHLHDHAAVGALRGQRVVVRFALAPSTVASRLVSALRHTFFSTQLNG